MPTGLGPTTIIHNFGDGSVTNDGQTPMSGLSADGSGNLYGTTIAGGSGSGTLYGFATNLTPLTISGGLTIGTGRGGWMGEVDGAQSRADSVLHRGEFFAAERRDWVAFGARCGSEAVAA